MTNNEAYQRLRELTRDNVLDELHPAPRPAIVAVLDEIEVLRERLARVEGPAQKLVDIDNDLAEGRNVAAKATFHDRVMRPIEELRVYFGNVVRAEKRGQTIFDVEVERRKRAEREAIELRTKLGNVLKELATAHALRKDAEQSLRVQAQSYRDEIHELRDRLTKLESLLDGECPTSPFPSCECCNTAARARELIASNEST